MSTIVRQWNARSVVAHHPFLERHISTSATISDVICIQETFLHHQLRFAMENYNIKRLDRPAGGHGRIVTLIGTGISYSVLNNPSNQIISFLITLITGTSSIDNLYILQWNVIGFMTHSAELRNHIARKSGIYDIICIHETFLKPNVKFNIAGYVTLRRDRLDAG